MITREEFDRMMVLDNDQLLAENTKEAADFLLARLSAESEMSHRGDELARQGTAWWLDKSAHGMQLEKFFSADFQPQSTTPPPAVQASPAPTSCRTIAEIEADSERIVAAEKVAAASEAKAGWANVIAKATAQVEATRKGQAAAPTVPVAWAATVARFCNTK